MTNQMPDHRSRSLAVQPMDDRETYHGHDRPEVAALLPRLAADARILEIGCGRGRFANHVMNGTREYWGIEPFADAARAAEATLHRVIVGTFRDAFERLPDCYFDCIVCNDVIEHMDDHDWFLEAIKTKMRDGATIVGSIPNVRHISNLIRFIALRDWHYEDSGILDRTHLRFFTEKSMRRSFVDHAYVIEAFCGINASRIGQADSAKGLLVEIGKRALVQAVGADTRFPQFAFCVRRAYDASGSVSLPTAS